MTLEEIWFKTGNMNRAIPDDFRSIYDGLVDSGVSEMDAFFRTEEAWHAAHGMKFGRCTVPLKDLLKGDWVNDIIRDAMRKPDADN